MSEVAEVLYGELSDGAFFAPASSDLVDSLIGQYKQLRDDIEMMSGLINTHHASVHHFLEGNQDHDRRHYFGGVSNLFKLEGAIASLNATFWQKALNMTDVYEYMPNNRRTEWNEQIREMKTPDFEEETVRPTIMELLNSRQKFFSERVDGIFRALSGDHVTNRPEGFGKRMILSRVFNEYGTTNHDMSGYIQDLRQLIAKFMGRDEPRWRVTDDALQEARCRHGEWLVLDGEEAKQVASEANDIIAEQRTRQILSVNEKIARMRESREFITVTTWLDRYLAIQQERLETGDIKLNSVKQKKKPVELLRQHSGMMYLKDITTLEIAEVVDAVKAQGYNRMAQVVRTTLIDVFKEAQHAGHVPPGYNPAQATRQPRNRVIRERLSLEEWKEIYAAAEHHPPYLQCAMLLAVVTGQRIGDISRMKFSDIWDDMLHVEHEKTGAKVALPLSLRCDALNISLREVVAKCRDAVVSKYLVHFRHSTSQATRGDRVSANSITTTFKKARNRTGISWPDRKAPTFHEQRSLSERLYEAQGIDTQKLLGHKSPQQTAKYHDDRGKDWTVVAV